MESKSPGLTSESQETLVNHYCTPLDPAALLLTTAPMKCLNDELGRLAGLGPHLDAVAVCICYGLEQDRRASNLREALKHFSVPMWSASREVLSAFYLTNYFYTHAFDELPGFGHNPGPITQARVAKLLEPEFQIELLGRARDAASQAAEASKAIREHLHVLQQLEKELDAYVADHAARAAEMDKRKKSWIPLAIQNVFLGAIEPTPWTTPEVQSFPGRLSIVSHLLHQVPVFLDNLELHFRRLSEVDSQQILEHGHWTMEDFTRLFQDRIRCQRIADAMMASWIPSSWAFATGT